MLDSSSVTLRTPTTMQETGNNRTGDNLSIRFSADGFSFCADGKRKSVNFTKADKSFHRSMAVCMCESDVWNDYKSVSVQIDSDITSLIPSSVFSDDDCHEIIKFNFPGVDFSKYQLHTDYIEGFDITNLYVVSRELDKFIEDNFPYAGVTHLFSRLVQEALRSSRAKDNRELWLHINGNTMYAAATKGGSLLLANRFPISGTSDVLYWTGSIYNHYNLSQQTVPLWISGDTSHTDALKERIALCNTFTL